MASSLSNPTGTLSTWLILFLKVFISQIAFFSWFCSYFKFASFQVILSLSRMQIMSPNLIQIRKWLPFPSCNCRCSVRTSWYPCRCSRITFLCLCVNPPLGFHHRKLLGMPQLYCYFFDSMILEVLFFLPERFFPFSVWLKVLLILLGLHISTIFSSFYFQAKQPYADSLNKGTMICHSSVFT